MSEAPHYSMAAEFDRRFLKKGAHVAALPVAPELFQHLGLVIAYWGTFENQVDSLLAGGFLAEGIEPDSWRRRRYAERMDMLTDLIGRLRGTDSEDAQAFQRIRGRAANLHFKRNIVAHGTYRMRMKAHSSLTTFWAEKEVRGRLRTIEMSEPALSELWHDIAHLLATFMLAASKFSVFDGFCPVLEDTYLLEAFEKAQNANSTA